MAGVNSNLLVITINVKGLNNQKAKTSSHK